MDVNLVHLLALLSSQTEVFLLDSCYPYHGKGRFSFLGFSPVDVIEADSANEARRQNLGLPAVGMVSYEGHWRFALYDTIIVMDHQRRVAEVKSYGSALRRRQAKDFIKEARNRPLKETGVTRPEPLLFEPSMTSRRYQQAVRKALTHIHEGNIYQINVTYAQQASLKQGISDPEAVAMYCFLRKVSPTHLSAFLKFDQSYVLCNSPERFLSLDKGVARVSPMKGTRPRFLDVRKDAQNRRELLKSAKEKAELLMVTDLARNDLGRVCATGSVQVETLRAIEPYQKVYQATATVQGKLRKDKDIFDLIDAVFPSGSVTGCPKLSAISIINQLEPIPRGFYTGALGYFGFEGKADFNVIIRTIFIKDKSIRFHVGSGIVADSDPKAEYEETLVKGQAMVEAIQSVFPRAVVIH